MDGKKKGARKKNPEGVIGSLREGGVKERKKKNERKEKRRGISQQAQSNTKKKGPSGGGRGPRARRLAVRYNFMAEKSANGLKGPRGVG